MKYKNGYPSVTLTENFGIKGGSNFVQIRCFKTDEDAKNDTNLLGGDTRHIGIGYLKHNQTLSLSFRKGQCFENEGGGLTYSVNVIMDKQTFKRKFDVMCLALTEGLSVSFPIEA